MTYRQGDCSYRHAEEEEEEEEEAEDVVRRMMMMMMMRRRRRSRSRSRFNVGRVLAHKKNPAKLWK